MNNNYIEPFTKLQDTTRQLSDVVRWQATKQVINCPYSVAVHGYNCANIYILLCRVLSAKINGQMMCILLNHDNMEALTGDLLAPAKDHSTDNWDEVEYKVQTAFIDDIASNYDGVLREIAKRAILTDDNIRSLLKPSDFLLFKLIDMYEFLLRAIEEVQAGNRSPGVLKAIDYSVVSFCSRGNVLWDKAQTNEHGQFYADSYELLHTVLQQKLRDIDYTK